MNNDQKTEEILDKALQDIRHICDVAYHDPDYESMEIEPILKAVFDHGIQQSDHSGISLMTDKQTTEEILCKALQDIRYACGVDVGSYRYEKSMEIEPILKAVFDHGVLEGLKGDN